MNLQRLEIVEAIIRHEFNVSKAAKSLRQSQPGLSKHLQLLEAELGFQVFRRNGRRLIGLSEPGQEVHRIAARMLRDRDALGELNAQYKEAQSGSLVIATTHTQARYALPKAVSAFRKNYPGVHLMLHQGSPAQVMNEVLEGQADIAIATEGLESANDLLVLPCYQWNRSVIAPVGHPILSVKSLTLEEISRYPIITYASDFTGRSQINAAFAARGLRPEVVLSAIDADIIKTYVALGLGIGIVASMAFDETADQALKAIDAGHLFPESTTGIAIRRGAYLRGYAYSFIESVAPHLKKEAIEKVLVRSST